MFVRTATFFARAGATSARACGRLHVCSHTGAIFFFRPTRASVATVCTHCARASLCARFAQLYSKIMTWPRRPCTDPPCLEFCEDEDRFACHLCNAWMPWRQFTMGFDEHVDTFATFLAFCSTHPDHRHGCNHCVKRLCWTGYAGDTHAVVCSSPSSTGIPGS